MKKLTKWMPAGERADAYRQARQEWDNRIGAARVQARNWRTACFAALGAVGLSIGVIGYLGAQPKAVPHIIEIDRIGAAQYRGAVGTSVKGQAVPDKAVRYHLRRFVMAIRTISSDTGVIKTNLLEAYSVLTAAGQNLLSRQIEERSPFKRAADERISVDVKSMVPVTRDTWQIDWQETRFDRNGVQIDAPVWRGMFRIVFRPSNDGIDEAELDRNPLGLYVDEFHVSRVQS